MLDSAAGNRFPPDSHPEEGDGDGGCDYVGDVRAPRRDIGKGGGETVGCWDRWLGRLRFKNTCWLHATRVATFSQ
jgi:hypothetical protein